MTVGGKNEESCREIMLVIFMNGCWNNYVLSDNIILKRFDLRIRLICFFLIVGDGLSKKKKIYILK